MPIDIVQIRELLLPGLLALQGRFHPVHGWEWVEAESLGLLVPKPHIWVPKLTVAEMAIAAAAVVLTENPVVTRRFWSGWFT